MELKEKLIAEQKAAELRKKAQKRSEMLGLLIGWAIGIAILGLLVLFIINPSNGKGGTIFPCH